MTTWKFPEKLTVIGKTSFIMIGYFILFFKSLEWKVFCFHVFSITHTHIPHTCILKLFLPFGAVLEKKTRCRDRNNSNVIIQIYKIFIYFRKFDISGLLLKIPFLLGNHIYQNEFFSSLNL